MTVETITRVVVNGREYESLDEVPPELREACERALATGKPVTLPGPTMLVVNGTPLTDLKDLPGPLRELVGKTLSEAAAEVRNGRIAPDPDPSALFRLTHSSHGPIEARGLGPATLAVVGLLIVAAGVILYRLLGV